MSVLTLDKLNIAILDLERRLSTLEESFVLPGPGTLVTIIDEVPELEEPTEDGEVE